MNQQLRNVLRKFADWLLSHAGPDQDQVVTHLVLHTANLELVKGEYTELAPMPGCCGPFKLYGNSLPVFEYRVFDKKLMEFIHMRVEVAKPDRITYFAKIESTSAPERNGEEVPVKSAYKRPFEKLALHLYHYFPIWKKAGFTKASVSHAVGIES